jgi:hypothetical protein
VGVSLSLSRSVQPDRQEFVRFFFSNHCFDLRVALVGNFNQLCPKTYFKLVESVFYGHGPVLLQYLINFVQRHILSWLKAYFTDTDQSYYNIISRDTRGTKFLVHDGSHRKEKIFGQTLVDTRSDQVP